MVCPALRLAAHDGGVTEHGGQWNLRLNDAEIRALGHVGHLPAPGVDVADDVAEVVLGRDDLDGHDGFEQRHARLVGGRLKAERTGNLEGGC